MRAGADARWPMPGGNGALQSARGDGPLSARSAAVSVEALEEQILEERKERFQAVNELWTKIGEMQKDIRSFRESARPAGTEVPPPSPSNGLPREARDMQELSKRVDSLARAGQQESDALLRLAGDIVTQREELASHSDRMKAAQEACERDIAKQGKAIAEAFSIVRELQQYAEKHFREVGKRIDSLASRPSLDGTGTDTGGARIAALGAAAGEGLPSVGSLVPGLQEDVARQFLALRAGVADAHLQAMRASRLALLSPQLSDRERRSAMAVLEKQERGMTPFGTQQDLTHREETVTNI